MLLTEPPQRSIEWHAQRSGKLTASLYGAALGLSPHMSRQALWRQLTGRSAPFAGNVATDYGNEHEAEALSAYEVREGVLVMPAPFVPFEDWSGASPDGFVGSDGLVEIKCPFAQVTYEAWPEHYRPQVIGQLAITGRKWCDCFCWCPHGGIVVERIQHDEGRWQEVLSALRTFWKYVLDDVEPPRQAKFKFKGK